LLLLPNFVVWLFEVVEQQFGVVDREDKYAV